MFQIMDSVLLGDSIPKHVGNIHGMKTVAYRSSTILKLIEYIRQNQIPELNSAKIIFLVIGTNDVAMGHTYTTIVSRMKALCKLLRRKYPGAVTVVGDILPRCCDFLKTQNLINNINQSIRAEAILWDVLYRPTAQTFFKNKELLQHLFAVDKLHLGRFGIPRLRFMIIKHLNHIRKLLGQELRESEKHVFPPRVTLAKSEIIKDPFLHSRF